MPTMTKETHWSVYNVVSSARSDVTFLPPATNLRQGNIFTRMWQGDAWWGGHGWQGAYMAGAHTGRGGMCGRGACVVGGHA